MSSSSSNDTSITVKDNEDQRQNLVQKEPHVAMKTLGVHLAPDGNNKEVASQLKEKALDWSEKIKTSHLDKAIAWKATETTICKSL